MNEHRYAKYGAATGIVFVIFLIVGFLIVFPKPPDTAASAPEWANYFMDHQNAVRAALTIVGVGTFFFLWFLGSLRSALTSAEGGTGRLASIALRRRPGRGRLLHRRPHRGPDGRIPTHRSRSERDPDAGGLLRRRRRTRCGGFRRLLCRNGAGRLPLWSSAPLGRLDQRGGRDLPAGRVRDSSTRPPEPSRQTARSGSCCRSPVS